MAVTVGPTSVPATVPIWHPLGPDDDEKGVSTVDTPGGPQQMVIINEPPERGSRGEGAGVPRA